MSFREAYARRLKTRNLEPADWEASAAKLSGFGFRAFSLFHENLMETGTLERNYLHCRWRKILPKIC